MENESNPSDGDHNETSMSSRDYSSDALPPTSSISALASWKPDDTFFATLISMGISPLMSKKALYYTHNVSAEVAIEWIFNQPDTDSMIPLEMELKEGANVKATSSAYGTSSTNNELYKMVFIVNAELSMGVGKIAAQVAHATLGLHRILLQDQNEHGENLLSWSEYGETTVVLKGSTTQHLIELEQKAVNLSLPSYLVHDAGKTQVQSGSTTVLAVFGSNSQIDQVSGDLKLY